MDGVFMGKLIKFVWTLALVLGMFLLGTVIADKHTLSNQMIRLRVVAASDSSEDQRVKLQVRDAVNDYLEDTMPRGLNAQQAKAFLTDRIQTLTQIAAKKLEQLGVDDAVRVYLSRESADTRHYGTFSLPAGIYETLRVDIGEAEGENWWCVVFPSLCAPVTAEAFQGAAVSGGMGEELAGTLSGEPVYRVRFFLLDCLGKLENFLENA